MIAESQAVIHMQANTQAKQTICLLNDSFPPLIDGVANAVVNYARQISESGYKAMVITPNHPDADDGRFPYPVVRYPSIDIRERIGYLAGVPFSPEVANRISQEKVALLHSHCPIVSTLLARQLRQIVDAPLVMTYHTKFDIEITNILHSKLLQSGSRKALVQNISACDEVWVVSQGAGENLRALGYEGEYIVMPNGVDLPCGAVPEAQVRAATDGFDLPCGVPVFLFVGRMQWYKGQKIILDALARLAAAQKDFRMVFVGTGADYEAIQAYAQTCAISEKCIFTGAIQDREVLRAWYSRADLFLFPSTFDTNGLVVREAAASCVASVLIRGSCASEGITDGRNGFLIEEDPQSLFACLLPLCDNADAMRQAGQAAAKEVYVSWETAVTAAMARYEIVIDRYKSGGYPSHRQPMEVLLKANGDLMEELGNLIPLRKQIYQRIKARMPENL